MNLSLAYRFKNDESTYPHILYLEADGIDNRNDWYRACEAFYLSCEDEFDRNEFQCYALYGGQFRFSTKTNALKAKLLWNTSDQA